MIKKSNSETIILSQDDREFIINPKIWNFGLCTDGDYNSINLEFYVYGDEPPKLPDKSFFTIETSQLIVEKASISNITTDSDKSIGLDSYHRVKLLIHFHSKIIRDIDKYKKMLNRKKIINKIINK